VITPDEEMESSPKEQNNTAMGVSLLKTTRPILNLAILLKRKSEQ